MELTAEQRQSIEAQKQNCLFCQIAAGSIPAKKVYEDDTLLGVLDINPASKGHVLVLPKEHYPILPLMPPEVFTHLFRTVADISHYLRKAMVVPISSVFVANGPAAGQQSNHFLVHLIPSDKRLAKFALPENAPGAEQDQLAQMLRANLPRMLGPAAGRFPVAKQPETPSPGELAELIAQNPEFRQMLIEKPEAVLAGLDENPSLKPLFDGVDVHELSARLKAQDAGEGPKAPAIPRAVDISDDDLRSFIDGNEKLRQYLLEDIDTLKRAIEAQPNLQRFFEDTTPEAVRERYGGAS